MITRREMNAFALTAFFSGAPAALVQAQGLPARNDAHSGAPNTAGIAVKTLMQEPLGDIVEPEVTVITLTLAPAGKSPPHEHIGPVFAYILAGAIENQVEPQPPKRYHAGEFFYEPARHVHRMLRNLSTTEPARLLIFQVGQKGKAFTIGVR